MKAKDFLDVLNTFIDPGEAIVRQSNQIVFSINGNSSEISIIEKDNELLIGTSDGSVIPSKKWITKNLAHIDLLAERISTMVKIPEHFIVPSIKADVSDSRIGDSGNPITLIQSYFEKRSYFETNLLYVVSGGGQGKTTLLSELAVEQAKKYKRNETSWLFVPIPLGGRTFLRFDDVTVGVLQNYYRFSYLYYNSFVELVKMGVIVPAYDGFEELFVETSSDNAFSAMNSLVESFDSQGSLIIAARKAYFDFENLKLGEQVIDNLKAKAFVADKVSIEKWDKTHFVEYAQKRGINNGLNLYNRIIKVIDKDSPILNRPVFVKKLLDICEDDENMAQFINRIQTAQADVIRVFIERIIEREQLEKWVDKTGSDGVGRPLLTKEEHFEILADVAQFMWENKTDSLNNESMVFVSRFFSSKHSFSDEVSIQVAKRILSHALIIFENGFYSFEHVSFMNFFLGYGIAEVLNKSINDNQLLIGLKSILNKGILPDDVLSSIICNLSISNKEDRVSLVSKIAKLLNPFSNNPYTKENLSSIIISLSDGLCLSIAFDDMSFPTNALRSRNLSGIHFNKCLFQATSFEGLVLTDCVFSDCVFEKITFPIEGSASFTNDRSSFDDCKVDSICFQNESFWNPEVIKERLSFYHLINENKVKEQEEEPPEIEIVCLEKIQRYLLRSTYISESVLDLKLGANSKDFISNSLPELIRIGLFEEIPNHGGTPQKRYRLKVSLKTFSSLLEQDNLSYSHFKDLLSKHV